MFGYFFAFLGAESAIVLSELFHDGMSLRPIYSSHLVLYQWYLSNLWEVDETIERKSDPDVRGHIILKQMQCIYNIRQELKPN